MRYSSMYYLFILLRRVLKWFIMIHMKEHWNGKKLNTIKRLIDLL